MSSQAPCILDIQTIVIGLVIIVEWAALAEGAELPRDEVRVAQAGSTANRRILAGEVQIAVHTARVQGMHVGPYILPADRGLVLAPNNCHVLGGRIIQRVEV